MSHTTTPLAYTQASLPALPHVPGTDPARSALDLFRTAIAARLVAALPALSLEQAYAGVDYGKKGEDFTVALPRFRLPGGTDVLAKAVTDSVSAPAAADARGGR
jgi:arginyl-tRNA synthetase